jgi:hypothetical protein
MLMSALFADAMGRDMMPTMYPQPAERAPAAYVDVFLRALGARVVPGTAPRVTPGAMLRTTASIAATPSPSHSTAAPSRPRPV